MGMSASQARYLQLTARKSDVEYQAQQIAQKRLTLAERTEIIAKRYTERMDDRRLYYNANYEVVNKVDENGQPVFDENGNQLTELKYLSDSFNQKRLDFYCSWKKHFGICRQIHCSSSAEVIQAGRQR